MTLAAKRALRRAMRKRLRDVVHTPNAHHQASLVLGHLWSEVRFAEARCVAAFYTGPSSTQEFSMDSILDTMWETGKAVYLPRVVGDDMVMLRVEGRGELEHFDRNQWDIPEPPIEDHRLLHLRLFLMSRNMVLRIRGQNGNNDKELIEPHLWSHNEVLLKARQRDSKN